MKNRLNNIFYVSLFLILFTGCAKHNAGIVKQTYHDLTSHYNGLFNARENYKNQLKTLNETSTDNYDKILSINPYGKIEDIAAKNGALDISIAKARLVVQTHQEKKEGKNYKKNGENSISNWADDAFLMIGKSYYMQGEMDSAISCFRYITAHFEDGVDARSKKKIKKQKKSKKLKNKAKKQKQKLIEAEKKQKDIRPSKKLLVHEPAYSEALVWLAKAYIGNTQYTEAQSVLTFIESEKNFLKNYDNEVEQTKAMLHIKMDDYNQATDFLKNAINKNKKKQSKNARMQFIVAQLYEKQNKTDLAGEYYKKSIKKNNNFEMIFYAKLKLIQMNRKAKNIDKATKKLIAKMLRDNKNKDFYDQLYYEKALIALEDDEREDAKDFLLKSIEKSITNQKQKGKSLVKLADLNYEEELYKDAQIYYDSSLSFIDSSFIDYNQVQKRADVLTELIAYLNTISLNDSLLMLANMSAKDLEALLYEKAVDEVDRQIKEAEKNTQSTLMALNNTGKNNKGSWYFYSSASRNNGYKKFKQLWGDIVLEDNWRRSNRTSDATFDDNETDGGDAYISRINETYDTMLEAVPKNDTEKEGLKNEIIEAYYNSGILYKLGLENYPKSIEMFSKLNKLYAKNTHEDEVLYQLYILYTADKKTSNASVEKNKLLSQYPNSKYAKLLKNPTAANTNSLKEIEDYYDSMYQLYQNENYDGVLQKMSVAESKFPQNHIQAKFDLLKALAIGGKKQLEPFKASLTEVINKYQDTEEQRKASEILAYLNGEGPKVQRDKPIIKKPPVKEGMIEDVKNIDKNSDNTKKNKEGLNINIGKKEFNIGKKNNPQEPE